MKLQVLITNANNSIVRTKEVDQTIGVHYPSRARGSARIRAFVIS